MPVENIKSYRMASGEYREGRNEDPELSAGTFHIKRKRRQQRTIRKRRS